MTGRYKAYPEYKETNLSWLGKVPSHWETVPLKHLANLNPKKSSVDKEMHHQDCSFLPMDKLKLNSLKLDETKQVSEVFDGYTYFEDGDVLLAKVTPCFENKNMAVARGLKNGLGFGSSEIYVLRTNNKLHNQFLFYRLQEDAFMDIATAAMSGAGGLKRVPAEVINTYKAAFPEFEEQQKIANFLDHETAKIDTLITKQEKLIELLKEKRQAVISHAVTKGLNPDAPMKDSGVEWLGEVPEHWVVSKFAYLKTVLTDYTANGSFADLKANVEYKDSPSFARLVRLTDLRVDLQNDNGVWIDEDSYKYLRKSALHGGEFLLANVGAYAGLFYQMPFNKGPASLAPNMFMAKFNTTQVKREFMAYVGQSDGVASQLKLSATAASAQPKLNKDDFKSVRFTFPCMGEQQEIIDYLNIELPKLDLLMSKQVRAIELMKERKTALISAAVTGKIDLRDWEAM
ncbi:restriction endonuclease subunit S [Vibrio sp. LaRot3]|uniref:restriction endonuclease subunit S n=1 Tax=Vibrio sp. LaRot3 TaxID=2998829 RepID=UPI0022CDCE43|nr:restriction endonuclease subunit S [Vibrio sp. LaRot3]MDA0148273.1 restriction endonuclease subunit S [Vibrio sp. LaRot3]